MYRNRRAAPPALYCSSGLDEFGQPKSGRRRGGLSMHFRLIINPESDAGFVNDVERTVATHREMPSDLEQALRPTYPNVKVRDGVTEQDGRKRWYVYREGRWTAS
ncbi:MAG TPA: hypothetical protein VEX62_04775 [Candidatus Limnocylindrales bacterium]|nr:hypothetical protein [Candidatus Limnocylindrales bacterium]